MQIQKLCKHVEYSNSTILQPRSTQIMHACIKFAKNKTKLVILQETCVKDENVTNVIVLISVAKKAKKFT